MDACSSALADRPTFVELDEVTVPLPDDDVWNGLDDYGLPMPGSKGDKIAATAAQRGVSAPFGFGGPWKQIPSGAGSNTMFQQFPSYGFREFVLLMKVFSRILSYVRGNKSAKAQAHSEKGIEDPEINR
jgi:hypothetical protein